jgi:hypothetical protein
MIYEPHTVMAREESIHWSIFEEREEESAEKEKSKEHKEKEL